MTLRGDLRERSAGDVLHGDEAVAAPLALDLSDLVACLTSPDWIQCDELPIAIEIHPDDVKTEGSKPYLLAGSEIRSPYRARYCHTASPEFIPDLMRRMLGR